MSRRSARETSTLPKTAQRDGRNPAPLMFEVDGEAIDSAQASPFPRARVAELGRSGGETSDGHVTADDLSPETLLDDDASRSPAVHARREPQDVQLRRKASEVGLGTGMDEAELANQKPVGHAEAARLKRRSEQHARDARFMEPAGAAEMAQRKRRERRH